MRTIPALLAAAVLFAFLPAHAADFDSAGIKIHYESEGRGEPVILIHGLHASAQLNWGLPGITADLARQFRVITLDCRGHGQSGSPRGEGAYGVQMVEDVARLMDHLKLPAAHLVGYSMGGLIALKLAVLHPGRVRSITLGGMGWLPDDTRLQDFRARMGGRGGPLANSALLRGFAEFAVTAAQVKAIKAPLAVVVGERDPIRQLYVAPLLKLRPEIPEWVIAGAGHLSCVAEPEFKTALKAALARAGGG